MKLSKIIATKEWLKAQKNLLQIYEALTPSQRLEIKRMLAQ